MNSLELNNCCGDCDSPPTMFPVNTERPKQTLFSCSIPDMLEVDTRHTDSILPVISQVQRWLKLASPEAPTPEHMEEIRTDMIHSFPPSARNLLARAQILTGDVRRWMPFKLLSALRRMKSKPSEFAVKQFSLFWEHVTTNDNNVERTKRIANDMDALSQLLHIKDAEMAKLKREVREINLEMKTKQSELDEELRNFEDVAQLAPATIALLK